jgi:hypothetical protein
MDFCLAVDSDAVFEPSIGFRNDGSKAPSFGGFDLLDEVDAVRVVGSVEKSAEWFDGGYPKSPLEKTLSYVPRLLFNNLDTDMSHRIKRFKTFALSALSSPFDPISTPFDTERIPSQPNQRRTEV